MIRKSEKVKNYTYFDYTFEETTVRYVLMDETKKMFMLMVPRGMEDKIIDNYETTKLREDGYPDHRDWFAGTLVHIHLSHHMTPMLDNSLKYSETVNLLKFDRQEVFETENSQTIKTYMKADEGYSVCHILTHYNGENGFEVNSEFYNNTGRTVTLETISSVSLDNLCPFFDDAHSENLVFHHFKGGWSIEGKHIADPIERLGMDKSWGGSYECEKIGSIGSKTVGRNYPYAALEDTKTGCIWGVKTKHNATWQIELSRFGSPLSLSAGIGDLKFGSWSKKVADGESYVAPVAYAAVAKGSLPEVSNALLKMNDRDIDAYGEEGMPLIFNDWVTHLGDTSEEKLLSLAKRLKDCGSHIKYFVVDDGWQKNGAGDWEVDETKFPKGFKAYTDKIREMGLVPGVWMEFESVRKQANRYDDKYNDLYLKKNGEVIINGACNFAHTKFVDFKNKESRAFLEKAVVEFLKENNIGYIKMDYNSNVGLGCDGADSLGQGLIEHMEEVYKFFRHIKEEIPEIIIENCSTGGSRLEPKMMSVTAMSSFSDALECFEVPVVAANLQYLISPRQNQIWCVLKDDFDYKHMQYVISSGFLGRLCWSGYIDKLNDEQIAMLLAAEAFYEKHCSIIKSGYSEVFRTDAINYRNLKGTQAVIRYSDDKSEALVVYHCFNESKELPVELKGKYEIAEVLFSGTKAEIEGTTLKVNDIDKIGNVLYLKRI